MRLASTRWHGASSNEPATTRHDPFDVQAPGMAAALARRRRRRRLGGCWALSAHWRDSCGSSRRRRRQRRLRRRRWWWQRQRICLGGGGAVGRASGLGCCGGCCGCCCDSCSAWAGAAGGWPGPALGILETSATSSRDVEVGKRCGKRRAAGIAYRLRAAGLPASGTYLQLV